MQPQARAMNLAPVKPLTKLGEAVKPREYSNLAEFIRELHLHFKNKNVRVRHEVAEQGRMMANLRSGKLELRRDPLYGTLTLLEPLPHQPRSDMHVYPLAQTNSSQLTSVWTLSRPRVVPRLFGDSDRAQIQTALVQQVIDHYATEYLHDEMFNQRESLSMMDYGTAVYGVYYDLTLNKITSVLPVVADTNKNIFPGYQYCMSCPMEGTPKDFKIKGEMLPRCPQCGTYNVSNALAPQTAKVTEVIGGREFEQGDILIQLEPVPAFNWDMRKLIHESSYVQQAIEIPHRLLESLLNVPIEHISPDAEHGIRVMNDLGSRGGSQPGLGRENLLGNTDQNQEGTLGWQEWYRPEIYAGVRFTSDEKTLSGETIKAGVPLEEYFKESLGVLLIGDDLVIGAFDEKCPLFSSVYHIQSHSGYGKGTGDAIEIAADLTQAHSAALATIKRYGAGGGFVYDKRALTRQEAKRILKPGGMAGADLAKSGAARVEDLIHSVTTNEVNQSNMVMIAQLVNMLNMAFQTTDFTQGVADSRVKVDTLGGQQLLQAQQQQRTAAPLRLKGYAWAMVLEEAVSCFRKHVRIPLYFMTGDNFKLTSGKYISGEDLPKRVRCTFVRDSEIPNNELTRQQNLTTMMQAAPGFGVPFVQLMQMEPRIASWFADEYKTDLPIADYGELLMRCRERLDQVIELAGEEEQVAMLTGFAPDPQMSVERILSQLSPPLDASELYHVIKAQILSDYLDNDEVKEWSPLTQMAVRALIMRHYQLDRDFRYGLQVLEAQGQAGVTGAAMAMAAPAMQAERDQATEDEAMGRAADVIGDEEAHLREQEAADADHGRAVELEQIKQRSKGSASKE